MRRTEVPSSDPAGLGEALRGARVCWWSRDLAAGSTTWSPEADALLGVPEAALHESEDAWLAAVHPDDRERVRSAIERGMRESRDYGAEFRVRRDEGTWRWIEARGGVRTDPAGTPVSLHGLWIDVTDRKRAEEGLMHQSVELARLYDAARRLSSTLDLTLLYRQFVELVRDAVPCDGMVVSAVDHERMKIRCEFAWVGGNEIDPATLPELNYDPASGGMQTEVIRTGEPRRFDDVRNRVRRPGGRFYEVDAAGEARPIRPDDSEPPQTRSAVMVPLKIGDRVARVVQVMADRDDAYGPEVLGLVESLAAPLAVAVQNAFFVGELQRTVHQLEEADRHRNAFLATLAHELRNPLAPIRNAVEVLRSGRAEEAELRWCREVIDRQAAHMSRLLDDLLDVSRITRNKLELRRGRVTLAEVIDSALETSRPTLDGARHSLTLALPPEPVWLHADLVRLAQVFSNLLTNAGKYTDPGGRITVTGRVEDDMVTVSVRDTGIGIAPEVLPELFEIFSQGSADPTRSQGGLGIGLSLVRGLVQLHHGSVEARSEGPGRGSEFVVRLPVARAAPVRQAAGDPESPARAPTGNRVLVVDDLRDSADSLAKLLELSGYEVRTAYGGREAVEIAAEFRPEAILLDMGMPDVDGYEAARRIRAEAWGRKVALVALTGWGQAEDRDRTRAAGFVHHLVKPVELPALLRILDTVCGPTAAREMESRDAT